MDKLMKKNTDLATVNVEDQIPDGKKQHILVTESTKRLSQDGKISKEEDEVDVRNGKAGEMITSYLQTLYAWGPTKENGLPLNKEVRIEEITPVEEVINPEEKKEEEGVEDDV